MAASAGSHGGGGVANAFYVYIMARTGPATTSFDLGTGRREPPAARATTRLAEHPQRLWIPACAGMTLVSRDATSCRTALPKLSVTPMKIGVQKRVT